METMMMREEQVTPDAKVLKKVLKQSYPAYEQWMNTVTSPEQGYTPEINYYRDGKAWLCKGIHKKKTVFWLSYGTVSSTSLSISMKKLLPAFITWILLTN